MAWQDPYDNSYPNPNIQNHMNDFKDQSLEDDSFGPSAGNIVSAFDAFRTQYHTPKSKAARPSPNTIVVTNTPN